MLTVDHVSVTGFEAALRGMRNPYDSWERADTVFHDGLPAEIGPNDRNLMQKLIRGGSEHRKFLRMIHVQMDVTAPLYWYKEADTYKVGTVANSCSTMHKIQAKAFTHEMFSMEHLIGTAFKSMDATISELNKWRDMYNESHDKAYWWQMIQLLPTSYNQTRTLDFNYENALTIIRQRTGHRLDEWHTLVDELRRLPMMNLVLAATEEKDDREGV